MLLLDTYNITHTTGILPPELAGIDVAELADLIRQSRYRTQEAVLVCDGDKNPSVESGRHGLITIRFAGKGKSADDLIAQLIQKSTTPRRLTVVSSDHEVLRTARKRRCETLTSEEFLQHLVNDVKPGLTSDGTARRRKRAPAKPSSSSMTSSQVDRWIDVFKVDEADLAAQVEKMAKAMEAEPEDLDGDAEKPAAIPRDKKEEQAESKSAANQSKPPHEKDPSKARHRVSTIDVNAAGPMPQAAIPDDLIAQAEKMLNDLNPPNSPTRRKQK